MSKEQARSASGGTFVSSEASAGAGGQLGADALTAEPLGPDATHFGVERSGAELSARLKSRGLVPRKSRTLASRVFLTYLVVLGFISAAAWVSTDALRSAHEEAELLRRAYLPLLESVRELVAVQDTYNAQLNHVTTALNPAEQRAWYRAFLQVSRPSKQAEFLAAIDRVGKVAPHTDTSMFVDLRQQAHRGFSLMEGDPAAIERLFGALARGDKQRAESEQDELLRRGLRTQRILTRLQTELFSQMDLLLEAARSRERTTYAFVLTMFGACLLSGVLMAMVARRLLAPVSQMSRRARAVARGDFAVQSPLSTGDEVGELSASFELMVAAIQQAQRQLKTSERLATIGRMAAHITHEVRNPLSSIALHLELLEDDSGLDEEAQELLRAISQEVARLTELSEAYLSMARRTPELEDVELGLLLKNALEFLRRELERDQVIIELEEPESWPWVSVDAGQFRQALFNLARNAREAMSNGGCLFISVTDRGEHVELCIEDEGPGVPESQREQLFEPFFTTKEHGTGLGLAVTREMQRAQGGDLRYEPGKAGARFVLVLPKSE